MIYRQLGESDLSVSAIGLGTWGIGGKPFWNAESDSASRAAIRDAIDLGINLIDTAPVYGFGHAESLIGEIVQPIRDQVIIATKLGLRWQQTSVASICKDCSRKSILEEIHDSLRRLRTDRIDLYQVHWPDTKTPQQETMEVLMDLRRQGKIRNIGVSNYSVEQLRECRDYAHVVSVQNQYSLLNRSIEESLVPYCDQHHIGILAYSPLGSGILTGKYDEKTVFRDWRGRGILGDFSGDAYRRNIGKVRQLQDISSEIHKTCTEIAINWVIRQPGISSALVGVKNRDQLRENINALDWQMTAETMKSIETIFVN